MTVALGYVILYVPDVEEAIAFYEGAFSLTRRFVHESGAYGELETGATVLAFASEDLADSHGFDYRRQRPEAAAGAFEVCLVTDDVAALVDRAAAAGARLRVAPKQTPWGQTIAYVSDPVGHTIEICTPVSR